MKSLSCAESVFVKLFDQFSHCEYIVYSHECFTDQATYLDINQIPRNALNNLPLGSFDVQAEIRIQSKIDGSSDKFGHRHLSLKILNIELISMLDFWHLCTYIRKLMLRIKISSPYHGIQMREIEKLGFQCMCKEVKLNIQYPTSNLTLGTFSDKCSRGWILNDKYQQAF